MVDPNGFTAFPVLFSTPVNGQLMIDPFGNFSYQPNPGFYGTDTFSYCATDGMDGISAPATVTITVNPLLQLTGVTISANLPSPQLTGTNITLSAVAQGSGITAGNVQYQFSVQYQLANGTWSAHSLLQDWSTSASCVWTPTVAYQKTPCWSTRARRAIRLRLP